MITQRQNDILNLIVELFTRHHEPVGSKALQEMIASSSATIRNDMAKLEQLGLLEKAHIKWSYAQSGWFSILCQPLAQSETHQ